MKKALILTIALLISIPLALAAQSEPPAEGYYSESYARLSFVKGDVYVQRTSDLGYETGEVNLALIQGDKLGTGNGQAEVQFGRRNYLRLDANTQVEFALLPREGDERVAIHVLEGGAYLRVNALPAEKGIEIDTPDASYYVLEEGLFRFDVKPGQDTQVFVHEGSLEAAGEGGSALVRSGESEAASGGRLLGDPAYFNARNDDFDMWSESRDSLLQQSASTRYLPSEMEDYENELDRNGNWVYEQPYGYVWVPVGVATEWRPYYYGRWVWYPVIGWNWVSSESWGWPVYHYGRWHWRGGLGWYWIPQRYWGPAWVHWWWDNDFIGWCPLSWYNRPVVIVNNRFYDRYRDSRFPVHNRAMTVIHRNQLQAAGVQRHALRSNELGRIRQVSLASRQPSLRPVADRTSPRAVEARRIFSGAASARTGARATAPKASPSATPSRLRNPEASPAAKGSQARPSVRSIPSRRGETAAAAGNSAQRSAPAGRVSSSARTIRSYPSRQGGQPAVGSGRSGRDAPTRVSGASKSGSAPAGETPARAGSSRRDGTAPAAAASKKATEAQKKKETGPSGKTVKSGERIKNYPSTLAASSSALRPRASTSNLSRAASSSAARSYPSRIQSGSRSSAGGSRTYQAPSRVSGSRSSSGAARSSRFTAPSRSSRSGSSPSFRSSAPRSSAPSRSRSSFSSASRSSRPSGRSVTSSSSGRSGSGRSSSVRSSSSRSSSSSSSRSSSSRSSSSGRSRNTRKRG